ncbi:MAG: hypothetical protein P0Y53_11375 [Candidatus Pseudobacter hemicellulosilyticus]|uniref:Uncharacterized protein n=1 Tax=Candidatus Pseudobacter hemicellulosilyticus TaxID=3121375 RepID=A0AAJ5WZ72_9BACT|nr:MAG: hypothetical protein P0Y53_11375 [Pseudobacter sp.]
MKKTNKPASPANSREQDLTDPKRGQQRKEPEESDEEARDLLDDDKEEPIDDETDISDEELDLLDAAGTTDEDDARIRRSGKLDSFDEDGDPLNEKGFGEDISGDDLDVPGSEADDDNEAIGEEDEENNPYSVDEENEDDERS